MNATLLLLQAERVSREFSCCREIELIQPMGQGLINDSFQVTTPRGLWVLQRINHRVFPEPEAIMANLDVLTDHFRRQRVQALIWPQLARTAADTTWMRDEEGAVWRMLSFIPGRPLRRIANEPQAREVGRLVGTFHRLLATLGPDKLRLSLPGFHQTPAYLDQFDQARQQWADPGRAELVEPLAFVESRRDQVGVLEEARTQERIPPRVVHGDPKLDNLLFDQEGQRALALIDLDTVQPGLVLHDIADCLRSCCNPRGEGAPQDTVSFDLAICRPLLTAYAHQTRAFLTEEEIQLLYDAVRLIPFELGLRFLTDHLRGDRWFRVDAPGQNLARAGVQFRLVADIETKEAEIRAIIAHAFLKLAP